MDLALDGIEGDWEVSRIGGEDGDGVARRKLVNGRLVRIGISLVIGRERLEGGIEVVVRFGDVLLQVLACCPSSILPNAVTRVLDIRIAGNLLPDVPTILSFPTFPRRLKSNIVKPTTPTFLSEPDIPPPTKPVVYSPVPTCCGQ